jgi:hypothetical protein
VFSVRDVACEQHPSHRTHFLIFATAVKIKKMLVDNLV